MSDDARGEGTSEAPDADLLALFHRAPAAAWSLFLERYSGFILAELERLGFARDSVMDGFVYICERLSDDGFRRLRSVRHLGDRGELVPWLRTVVAHLAANWVQARDGRRRLLKSIAALPEFSQRVFRLYFWRGLKPFEVVEELRRDGVEATSAAVFDSLEALFHRLSETKVWHLVSRLAKRQGVVSIDSADNGSTHEPHTPEPDPEQALMSKESVTELRVAMAALSAEDRLLFELRYEEALPLAEIASILGLAARDCERRLASARRTLRERLAAGPLRSEKLRPAAGGRAP